MIIKKIKSPTQYWKIINLLIEAGEERVYVYIGLFQNKGDTPTRENALIIRKYNFHIEDFSKLTIENFNIAVEDLYEKIKTMPDFN